jgi:hypothetical protein
MAEAMVSRGNTLLFGTRPRLTKELAVVAGCSAVVPHVVVALDQWSVTAAPWLSESLEPVLLLVGLGALWPVVLVARYGEWFGAFGSALLVGTAAVAFVPVVCNFMWAGKHPARPGPTPLEGGCLPPEGYVQFLAITLVVVLPLFVLNYAHWRLTTDSASG